VVGNLFPTQLCCSAVLPSFKLATDFVLGLAAGVVRDVIAILAAAMTDGWQPWQCLGHSRCIGAGCVKSQPLTWVLVVTFPDRGFQFSPCGCGGIRGEFCNTSRRAWKYFRRSAARRTSPFSSPLAAHPSISPVSHGYTALPLANPSSVFGLARLVVYCSASPKDFRRSASLRRARFDHPPLLEQPAFRPFKKGRDAGIPIFGI